MKKRKSRRNVANRTLKIAVVGLEPDTKRRLAEPCNQGLNTRRRVGLPTPSLDYRVFPFLALATAGALVKAVPEKQLRASRFWRPTGRRVVELQERRRAQVYDVSADFYSD